MKRLTVFAHYDKDNIIDEYVIYYLEALKEICNTIIFVSDCFLPENEQNKIKNIADYIIAEKHGEYDFGSYKRGFLLAKELSLDYDELLFVNDSCYGPFYPFRTVFNKMNKKQCDFWGLTANYYGIKKKKDNYVIERAYHIQSYFLLFKKTVFQSEIFNDFITKISKCADKNEIIFNYEIGLSKLLFDNGFKSATYVRPFFNSKNCTIDKWDEIILKRGFPLLKTEIIKKGLPFTGPVKNWKEVLLKVSNYPTEIITKNEARLKDPYEDKYSKLNIYRKVRYKILKSLPLFFTDWVIFLEKNLYNLFNTICFNKLKKF